MPAPRRVFDRIVKEGVARPLLAAGFGPESGKGTRAWTCAVNPQVTWSVAVQASGYPPEGSTLFTVNWGVLLPLAVARAGARSSRQMPYAGLLQGRLNHVAKRDQDRDWWCSVTADSGDDLTLSVRERIEGDLLPYLSRYGTAEAVLRAAERKQLGGDRSLLQMGAPGAVEITVAAMLLNGEQDRARTFIEHMRRKGFVPHLDAAERLLTSR